MTATELEYRIKLNNLRIKYAKNPILVFALCLDSANMVVDFAKDQYRAKQLSKLSKGGIAIVGENNKPEIIKYDHRAKNKFQNS